ncbi:hypothetical protein B0H10DRAFT_2093738 [Mycena sp. CBHHK59/15]|nr:hypothetical protein B0H10DRAFT_2093738 [Mycena sp. CBHHK59/15]
MPHDDIPDEMWSEIFSHLPRDALVHVHLAQRRFHYISRPLLFSEFRFHPKNVKCPPGTTSHVEISQEELVDIVLQRLEFWSSSGIAPFIRTCRVIGWRNSGCTAFFNSFPRFTNLFRLCMIEVQYNQIFMQNLHLLPNLTHLKFRNFTPNTVVDHWIPILRRDTVRYLDLSYNERLFAQIQAGDPFPYVKGVKILMHSSRISLNLRVISKFPATEVLNVAHGDWELLTCASSGESHVPLSDLLTSLREYIGPEDLLHLLFPIPSLRRLVLPYSKPEDCLAKLGLIKTPNNITSLNVQFSDFDHEVLRDLCGFFPHLIDLRIMILIPSWDEDGEEYYYVTDGPCWEVTFPPLFLRAIFSRIRRCTISSTPLSLIHPFRSIYRNLRSTGTFRMIKLILSLAPPIYTN